MKSPRYFPLIVMLLLAACGETSHRPTYSGHQESTEGVPGFAGGKKQTPYAKLGQSYTVDGETYVPKYQPGYTEEGLASWYGPGFHGGKTANGEAFDKNEMTAAHRTLPLPSMVKVTMIETGKSAIVRINDRGPFSKGRIIDLSRAAAEKIGLIGKGVGKVRVEYLGPETERFASLLVAGRDPKSIDVESEVLNQSSPTTQAVYASNSVSAPKQPNTYQPTIPQTSWASRLNPVSTAYAETMPSGSVNFETVDSVDPMQVSASDLAPPTAPAAPSTARQPVARPAISPAAPVYQAPAAPLAVSSDPSPFDMPEESNEPAQAMAPAPVYQAAQPAIAQAPAVAAPAISGGQYFQLGAFANKVNAENLRGKVASIGAAAIDTKTTADGATLYVVRMGPYTHVEESQGVLAQLNGLGINPKPITK